MCSVDDKNNEFNEENKININTYTKQTSINLESNLVIPVNDKNITYGYINMLYYV